MGSVSFNALNPRPAFAPAPLRFGHSRKAKAKPLQHPAAHTKPGKVPHVAVIDDFKRKYVDIDGDGVVDLSHGEVIERFLKAQLPTVKITRFQVEVRNGSFVINDIAHQLGKVRHWIDTKYRHFDAVNISISQNWIIQELRSPKTTITRDNLKQHRKSILSDLLNSFKKRNDLCEVKAFKNLQRLIPSRVPVYIGGGNAGEETFNGLNLFPGTINVGATYANGKKTDYTCDNSLINRWTQGTFAVTKVPGGFDLNGDGVPEALDSEVSGGKSLRESVAKRFVGKPLQEVLATDEEVESVLDSNDSKREKEIFENRLFSLEMASRMSAVKPGQLKKIKAVGEYVFLGRNRYLKAGFKVDDNGLVQYDPDGSGRKGVVNVLWGTSLATPWAIGEDLKAKFPQTR